MSDMLCCVCHTCQWYSSLKTITTAEGEPSCHRAGYDQALPEDPKYGCEFHELHWRIGRSAARCIETITGLPVTEGIAKLLEGQSHDQV